ncbi:MAG: transcription termination factor NusA [Ignavibacteriaceae bacterium]|nr:transcription termination factor NusA [Ignavibacteriaceae bacterium]
MNPEIAESFSMMVKQKNVDKDYLVEVLKDVFQILIAKKFGEGARSEVIVNMDRGDIEIYYLREIVDEVTDPVTQISLDEVNERGNEDELDTGDDYMEKIPVTAFGRRLINLIKQNLNQKIREIEKDVIFKEYSQQVGEMVVGDIYQLRKTDILVNHNKNELILPRNEQIPHEKYKKGDTIRAVIKDVRMGKNGPEVIISRADENFLRRLFEIEVPEIYDGIIEIKSIAREPGEKAKIVVESQDKRIDAVGACVGMKGVRVHNVVRELSNENIDVIGYTDDLRVMVGKALAPGKLKKIEIDADERKITVFADPGQAAAILGKGGSNIRLASRLLGYEINLEKVERTLDEYEGDIELIEIQNEIGEEIRKILNNNGIDTALDVLRAGKEKLMEISEFDEETVDRILKIINDQYEEN